MNLVPLIGRALTASLLAMVLGPSALGSETSKAPADDTLPAKVVLRTKRPLVIGHRGYPTVAPENSLASFHQALQAGVDLVELDYHHSLDGIPVVIHDGTLDRTTDSGTRWSEKGIRVDSRAASELVTLGVGGAFQPPFPGERLPTLAAALEFIQKRGITLIERKSGDPATLAALLKEQGLVNRVVVQSFDWEFLAAFHRLVPDQVLGALGPRSVRGARKLSDDEKALSASWLREIVDTGARVAVWNGQVDGAAVVEAHRLGLA
ncbi:MAG: hypothetical protein JNL97_16575, partial [Verrucomicrobiales bacterium]|nr:hypothetical protein [Verrucomicrobiales bacterium]